MIRWRVVSSPEWVGLDPERGPVGWTVWRDPGRIWISSLTLGYCWREALS